jgi:hypothetical protein
MPLLVQLTASFAGQLYIGMSLESEVVMSFIDAYINVLRSLAFLNAYGHVNLFPSTPISPKQHIPKVFRNKPNAPSSRLPEAHGYAIKMPTKPCSKAPQPAARSEPDFPYSPSEY